MEGEERTAKFISIHPNNYFTKFTVEMLESLRNTDFMCFKNKSLNAVCTVCVCVCVFGAQHITLRLIYLKRN